jgi:hypothetical protein
MRGGPGADPDLQDFYQEVISAWRDAGIEMLDIARLPEAVHGVPAMAIRGRLRGGAGGGVEQVAAQVFVTLWPLAAAGYVGAASADAWVLTKRGIGTAVKRLFGRGVARISIEVADDQAGFPSRDDSFVFDAEDAADVERAVDAMAEQARVRAVVEERTSIEYYWDPEQRGWVPEKKTESTRRMTTEGRDEPAPL